MPKISDERRRERRDQILDAALASFTEHGLQATSMSVIFEASGLSAGAVYGYFASKQELAMAVAQRAIAAQIDEVNAAAQRGDAPSPIDVMRGILARLRASDVPASFIVQLWGAAASDREFFAIASQSFRVLADDFGRILTRWAKEQRGMAEADAAAWSAVVLPPLIGMVQGCILQTTLGDEFDPERYLEGAGVLIG